ncbi:MAG: TlpA family protein disulfide reductase [Bryobacterales bacterium]|nr:TlpA family protein disulfide reductase [Bryobacterales bacterium]
MGSSRKSFSIQIFAGILLVALCWVIAGAMREPIVNAGDTAPKFKVVTDSGKTLTRGDFGGKVLVLNFWATWCPPCIEEIPSLDALQRQFGKQGLVVLAISVDKNEKTYRDFLKRANVSFQTARDPEADISSSYGTYKYPETYLVDRDGKVVAKYISNQDWMDQSIIKDIRALL